MARHSILVIFLTTTWAASACGGGDGTTARDAQATADARAPGAATDASAAPDAATTLTADASAVDAVVIDAVAVATGESCASPIPLSTGTATYDFTAKALDHLSADDLFTAKCITAKVLTGPDVVFAYQAVATGTLTITVKAKSDFSGGLFRMAAVLTDDPCASPVLDQDGGCASQYSETPSVTVDVAVVAGTTYYLLVAKTDSSPNTFLDSQVEITATES